MISKTGLLCYLGVCGKAATRFILQYGLVIISLHQREPGKEMPDHPSTTSPALRIRVLPARQGIAWLAQGVALIRAQPARLLFLAVLLQLILGLTRVPLLGLFVILAVPALSAGVLQAF